MYPIRALHDQSVVLKEVKGLKMEGLENEDFSDEDECQNMYT